MASSNYGFLSAPVPTKFIEIHGSLPEKTINFGCGGLELYEVDELPQKQIGYSVSKSGESFCGNSEGDWKPSWIVIGHELTCGDPIILDTSSPDLPVLTDAHGNGSWQPQTIATSVDAFAACFNRFIDVSTGRSNPVEREAHPVTDGERNDFLAHIAKYNGTDSPPEFWDVLLES